MIICNVNENTLHWKTAQFLCNDVFSQCKVNNGRCLSRLSCFSQDNGLLFLWGPAEGVPGGCGSGGEAQTTCSVSEVGQSLLTYAKFTSFSVGFVKLQRVKSINYQISQTQ